MAHGARPPWRWTGRGPTTCGTLAIWNADPPCVMAVVQRRTSASLDGEASNGSQPGDTTNGCTQQAHGPRHRPPGSSRRAGLPARGDHHCRAVFDFHSTAATVIARRVRRQHGGASLLRDRRGSRPAGDACDALRVARTPGAGHDGSTGFVTSSCARPVRKAGGRPARAQPAGRCSTRRPARPPRRCGRHRERGHEPADAPRDRLVLARLAPRREYAARLARGRPRRPPRRRG
jgi:hypothetical protein